MGVVHGKVYDPQAEACATISRNQWNRQLVGPQPVLALNP
jgi:hypothetical protein